jgi:ABC-type transport system involved in cytochrome bd biosynthesis fused ATPase/permease subunit
VNLCKRRCQHDGPTMGYMFLRLVIPNVAHCRLTAGAIRAIAWLSWRRGLLPMMVLNTELLLFLDAPGR